MLFGGVPMVEVDDLCRAEIFVAEKETASGRYICCGFNTTIFQLAHFLAAKYPQYNVKAIFSRERLIQKPRAFLSSAKLIKEGFEFKYDTLDMIYQDVVEYGRALGIIPK